jgi:hypothetical protein
MLAKRGEHCHDCAMPDDTDQAVPDQFRQPEVRDRIALIAASFERLLGKPLVAPGSDIVSALWNAPDAIVAHGVQDDPIFFFGNRAALAAFEVDVEGFTRMPSRLSAEAPLRGERQALLDRVLEHGFIDDYAGIRIASSGRRFRIEDAIVWNLIDGTGTRHGQAATFAV